MHQAEQQTATPDHRPWGTWQRAVDGTPVFVESLPRALRRRQVLRQIADGRWRRRYRGLR